MEKCPLCKKDEIKITGTGVYLVNCKVCGTYYINGTAMALLEDRPENIILSGIARNNSDRPIEITEYNLETLGDTYKVPRTVQEKVDHLLLILNELTTYYGEHLELNLGDNYPRAFCQNPSELSFLFDYLAEKNYIKRLRPSGSMLELFYLAYAGFEKVNALKEMRGKSDQCFVAMSFDKSLGDVYERGIRKAIIATGYKPLRVDMEEYVDKIDDKIISEIRKSGLMVADFTQHKHGVYFEAGFAFGLGVPVIWLCNKDGIENAHFDTNHYNHIVWNTPEDLYESLLNRINALFPLKEK